MTLSDPPRRETSTILIVDDTPANLGVVVEALEAVGYVVVVAQDGEEALQRAALVEPDLVLLDVVMPGLDGFDVCQQLARVPQTRDIPVILMTSLVDVDDKVRGFRAGAVDYVTKPIQIDEMLARVRTHLSLAAERRAAQHKRRLLAYALDRVDEAIYVLRGDSPAIVYATDGAARMLGYDRDALIGMQIGDLDPAVDEAAWRGFHAQLATRSTVQFESVHRTRDGQTRPVEVTVTRFEFDGQAYGLVVCRDVTERKRVEAELRQAHKMEAIGKLAGGVAHDFNNLLVVIQLQSSMLLAELQDDRARQGVELIAAATERAATLTRQLLTFSRRRVPQASDVDLAEVVGTIGDMLRRLLGADVALSIRLGSSPAVVHADRGMLEQVVMNLAVNARDAMPHGGRLDLCVERVMLGAGEIALTPAARPGAFVRLSIADSGAGIAPEHLAHIFEPFFTTKEAGHGTGLGLATALGIVQQHGGWIDVDSHVGTGTTFRVYLPALEATPAASPEPPDTSGPRGGHEAVLLVEDEPGVRHVTRVALERYGYKVTEAESAVVALERLAAGAPVDLLVTDMVMPGGMSGRELAERVLAERPTVKVIYTSGYSSDVMERQLPLGAHHRFLQKPYAISELAETVRQCLDAR